MALPVPDDIWDELQGFCLTRSMFTEAFVQRKIDLAVNQVEDFTRYSVSGEKEVTELYSGIGKDRLLLNRRNITELTNIRLVSGNDIDTTINLDSVLLVSKEGLIKVRSGLSEYYNYRIFPKGNDNIQITYKYGVAGENIPADLFTAIVYFAVIQILDQAEARTGGGQLSGQSYSRQYGNMGKWSHYRTRIANQASKIMRRYSTAVVGS